MNARNNVFFNADWWTILLFFLIAILGWLNIFSAVFDENHTHIFDTSQKYGKQLLWICASAGIALVIFLIDTKFYENFSPLFYVLLLVILVVVLFFGNVIAGSKSWFHIGGIAIQPSEFAKYTTALMLARTLTQPNVNLNKSSWLFKSFLVIMIPALLILKQNDTGSAMVFGIFLLVLYREGMPWWILGLVFYAIFIFVTTLILNSTYVAIILSSLAGIFAIRIRKNKKALISLFIFFILSIGATMTVEYVFNNILIEHQQKRINVLLGKEQDILGAGYNIHQSTIAIGSGGIFGKGYLQGSQTKFNFVPEQSTDFIFCTVGEEHGFIGTCALISLYVILLFRLIYLAERQRSDFARIYGYGVVSILFFHFMINIGMTIGLLPVIGIPLPMFSYGGSSLWAFTLLIFTFLRFDSHRKNLL